MEFVGGGRVSDTVLGSGEGLSDGGVGNPD
jgi:hypothetical protein